MPVSTHTLSLPHSQNVPVMYHYIIMSSLHTIHHSMLCMSWLGRSAMYECLSYAACKKRGWTNGCWMLGRKIEGEKREGQK